MAFGMMSMMMFIPMIIGGLSLIVANMGGFIEAAFMDMTLTLEGFDYGFGYEHCGELKECGNSTFDSYVRSRNMAFALFVMALVAVGLIDMLRGFSTDGSFRLDLKSDAGGDITLPQMLQYSILVFVFLFMFPPLWDAMASTMNNVGLFILNPHYELRSEYVHGEGTKERLANGKFPMCNGDLKLDDLLALAPYVRDWDAKNVIYKESSPAMQPIDKNGDQTDYQSAVNYVWGEKSGYTGNPPIYEMACLRDNQDCKYRQNSPGFNGQKAGDILCNPDLKVKYVFRQALGVVEVDGRQAPENVMDALMGGFTDIFSTLILQFIRSSVTLQIIMVTFITGVLVDVVTAFALAVLPIVFFYKFLPGTKSVKLGDYGGAAFALLSMPLVASLVLIAGAGAVSTMAMEVDEDDGLFATFFVWLAALAVVLLVIGLPATMVPLIGAAQGQATAAIQTGVQTASFAATTAASAAGGAVRGAREGRQLGALRGAARGRMSAGDRQKYDSYRQGTGGLNRFRKGAGGESVASINRNKMRAMEANALRGHEDFDRYKGLDSRQGAFGSTAAAAVHGGFGGAHSKLFDESGKPTKGLQGAMNMQGAFTDKGLSQMAGFSSDADTAAGLAGMGGVVDSMAAGTTDVAKATAGEAAKTKAAREAGAKTAAEAREDARNAEKSKKEATAAKNESVAPAKAAATGDAGVRRAAAAERTAHRNVERHTKDMSKLRSQQIDTQNKLDMAADNLANSAAKIAANNQKADAITKLLEEKAAHNVGDTAAELEELRRQSPEYARFSELSRLAANPDMPESDVRVALDRLGIAGGVTAAEAASAAEDSLRGGMSAEDIARYDRLSGLLDAETSLREDFNIREKDLSEALAGTQNEIVKLEEGHRVLGDKLEKLNGDADGISRTLTETEGKIAGAGENLRDAVEGTRAALGGLVPGAAASVLAANGITTFAAAEKAGMADLFNVADGAKPMEDLEKATAITDMYTADRAYENANMDSTRANSAAETAEAKSKGHPGEPNSGNGSGREVSGRDDVGRAPNAAEATGATHDTDGSEAKSRNARQEQRVQTDPETAKRLAGQRADSGVQAGTGAPDPGTTATGGGTADPGTTATGGGTAESGAAPDPVTPRQQVGTGAPHVEPGTPESGTRGPTPMASGYIDPAAAAVAGAATASVASGMMSLGRQEPDRSTPSHSRYFALLDSFNGMDRTDGRGNMAAAERAGMEYAKTMSPGADPDEARRIADMHTADILYSKLGSPESGNFADPSEWMQAYTAGINHADAHTEFIHDTYRKLTGRQAELAKKGTQLEEEIAAERDPQKAVKLTAKLRAVNEEIEGGEIAGRITQLESEMASIGDGDIDYTRMGAEIVRAGHNAEGPEKTAAVNAVQAGFLADVGKTRLLGSKSGRPKKGANEDIERNLDAALDALGENAKAKLSGLKPGEAPDTETRRALGEYLAAYANRHAGKGPADGAAALGADMPPGIAPGKLTRKSVDGVYGVSPDLREERAPEATMEEVVREMKELRKSLKGKTG